MRVALSLHRAVLARPLASPPRASPHAPARAMAAAHSAPAAAAAASAGAAGWAARDKRRMLHAVYRVGDMDAYINFMQAAFGMKLLRYRCV
jgi:hypothetical protein